MSKALTYKPILSWLNRILLQQKLHNPLGYLMFAASAVFASLVISYLGLKIGIVFIFLLISLPLALLCFKDLRIGLGVVIVTAFMVNFVSKYVNAPIGMALDGLLFLLLLSMLVHISIKRDFQFPKSALAILVLVWVGYNMLQVLNPNAASKMAWLYTVRSLAILQLLFFIAIYAMKRLEDAKLLLKIVLGMALLSALYGFKQEFFGYSSQEWAWLYESPNRYRLIVQWNRYRAFSFFSDPTTFGTLMAYMGTFSIVLGLGPFKRGQKILALISGLIMYLAMAFAGSRTPFLLVPASIAFYTLLTLKKEVLIGVGIFFMLGTLMVMKSTSNPVIFRIQSAFKKPTEDASMQVRLQNQKLIQPYIQKNPIGAGLGTTGVWGERFSPESWLAGFAHDSAYVRIAIEMGWVGLVIYLLMFFVALRTALFYYFRCINEKIKTIYLGLSVVIFMIGLASYPQEIVSLLPTSIVFVILLAIVVKLKDFDEEKRVYEGL